MNMTDIDFVAGLKSNMHACFDTPQGKEILKFLEQICQWSPTVFDSNETNDVISRDATRKIYGTIKTILTISPEQIVEIAVIVTGKQIGRAHV